MLKHRPVQLHKYFTIKEDKVERTRRYCPRCGIGMLAQHKNRLTCGKCTYVEFLKA